ncbi:MAG: DivIVA domain-containing protein [Vallitalea sp.]|jgi:cell division septum initiation protein DivIVA|nr:DivIVA domain-containing protein [Vallitalea sp.]
MSNSFSIVKKGYSKQEVDNFIRELEETIASYKVKEQYISKALVESHVASKRIIEEAEIHAFEIEKDALIQLEHLKLELNNTKKRLETFKNDYDTFTHNFKISFSDNELIDVIETIEELNDIINSCEHNKAM